MSQEYEITAFKPSDFKDQNGNTWCDIVLLGISEPVKIVVKDPSQYAVGQKLYGKITDETSKAGKPYLRFRKEQKPDVVTDTKQNEQSDEYWAERQNQIKAQFAIKAAIQYQSEGATPKDIEETAQTFYAMVDRIANPIDKDAVDIVNLKDIPL